MNRKKIALLLTGLVVTSGILTSCGSENKTANNSSKMVQEDSAFKRTSERTVKEYEAEEFSNVAYAEDIVSGVEENNLDININSALKKNKFNDFQNYDNSTTMIKEGEFKTSESFTDDVENYEFTPSSDLGQSSSINQNNIDLGLLNDENISPKVSDNETSIINNSAEDNGNVNAEKSDVKASVSSNIKEMGKITVLKASGASFIPGTTIPTMNSNKVQGIIDVSFKLSGEVISANGLGTLLQNAYEEARKDANNNYSGTMLDARKALADQLQKVFEPSNIIDLLFQSDKGLQIVTFNSTVAFPSDMTLNKDYLMNMVDLHYTDNISPQDQKSSGRAPENVVIKMRIRVKGPTDTLQTNTQYKYLGMRNSENFLVTLSQPTTVPAPPDPNYGKLVGFTIPGIVTTAKQSPNIKATYTEPKNQSTKYAIYDYRTSNYSEEKNGLQVGGYFEQIGDTTYINYDQLINNGKEIKVTRSGRAASVGQAENLEIGGTSIKYKNLILTDIDETITKVEFTDDRNQKYECKLVPIDSQDKSKGFCVEVVGLKRETPYVFKNMIITSNYSGQTESKTIRFAKYDSAAPISITQQDENIISDQVEEDSTMLELSPDERAKTLDEIAKKLKDNTTAVKTSTFVGPALRITEPTITLPGNLTVDTVKNDKTSLRYIIKVNNPEGLIGDIRVMGLRNGEQSKVRKIVDKDAKVNYYEVTLFDLTPNSDYGFVILETSYKTPNGSELETRERLDQINTKKENGDSTKDNRTEKDALTGAQRFNVVVNDTYKSDNPRQAEIPVFLDDMQGSFVRAEFINSKNVDGDVKFKFEDEKMKFSNLKPQSSSVFKVGFVYKDVDGKEQILEKFIKVETPATEDLDIKSSTVKLDGTTANVTFELYTPTKSPVKTVVVKDDSGKELKSTWSKDNQSLKIEDLQPSTNYKDVTITFTLENGKTIKHILQPFSTETIVVKPTGKVAEFVERVYKIALGREPEVEGWNFWIDKLQKKEITATEFIAENLMTQKEFIERELDKAQFVTTMYSLIVNREPDSEGQKYWERKYDEYKPQTNSIAELRIKIAREMMDQPEFKELVTNLNLRY